MKLLFIAEKYPPIVGGGETQLEQLATSLVSLGHQVTVATDRDGVGTGPDPRGVRLVHLAGLRRACSSLDCHEAVQSISRLLASEAPDALHVINYVPALLLSWLRPAVRVPLFFSSFETLIPGQRVFGLYEDFQLEDTLRRSVASRLVPDIVFCGSEAYRQWALAGGFDQHRLRVIPHSTDVERFAFSAGDRASGRKRRGWGPSDFVFLVPARPIPRKRIEDMLAAVSRLRGRHRLKVALTLPAARGDVAYLDGLRAQIAREHLEDAVHWEPDLAWTDMPALYSACDAVVLPSAREGFAIALIEAMAASRPVIATDIEGPNEFVVHGVTGLLYQAGNVGQLAELLAGVMETDTSAMVRAALAMTRERYSAGAMARCFADAYQEACRAGH
jgi:glycosyltransferase involved in cell wall biosynthesis